MSYSRPPLVSSATTGRRSGRSALWFRRAVTVVLGAVLLVGTQAVPASAAPVTVPLLVNFQSQEAPTPAGYTADYGQAFDATRGFGWTNNAGTPLSLVGNGRDRNVNSNQLLDTFMQMQLKAGSPGVTTPGAWRAEIANGAYQVTVAVGDPSYTDSRHVIRVEGTTAIDFTPTGTTTSATQTVTANVTDGFLNVDAVGGTNTKLDYIEIRPVTASAPTIVSVDPASGSTNVSRSQAVTVQLSDAVDSTTLNGLTLVGPNNTTIAGNRNTDAAGSNATFVPSSQLAANTQYTVQTNATLRTATGVSYTPFTSTFTTGASGDAVAPVNFNRSVFSSLSGVTALALSPDRTALYAAVNNGAIQKYNLDAATGNPVGNPTEIGAFKFQSTILGLEFDPASTAANPKLWVSHGTLCGEDCADFTGRISVLTGNNLQDRRDVITGLPRSVKDHMNNGIRFGPNGVLYIAQGSNTGYGAPDEVWGNRLENPLNATILTADVNGDTRFNSTVNVSTAAPTSYNPDAANAPVKIYTQGIRNPFSLVWHSNGKLYAPVNESASGNAPAGPGNNPPAINDLVSYNDYFTQVVPNAYYGHPNPSRGNYTLNGGNPTAGTDPFEVAEYPVGTQPASNWRQPDMNLGLHRSADGSVEFKSNVFGSNLQGQMLVTEYSQGDDVIAIKLDGNGKPASKAVVATGFFNPLAITSDAVNGRTYVGEYGRDPDGVGGQITLLSPQSTPVDPNPTGEVFKKINFQPTSAVVPSGYTADTGLGYTAAAGFGWENAAGAPLNLTANTRERNVNLDKRLDTFIHFKLGTGTEGRWQLDVPNGNYVVNLGLGDTDYFDSVNVVRAEGNVIANFTPTNAERNRIINNAQVTVTDGKLTIDQTGGTNTKIDFIDVLKAGTTPDPDPDPTPGSQVARVNFQPETAAVPAGYTADFGTAYSSARGFGWETRDSLPLNLVSNGRERNVVADQRLDTFMHMAFTGQTGGIRTEGQWSINVPNGNYKVVVGVGDPSYADSVHVIRAEGNVIGSYTPTLAAPNSTFTAASVAVTDGKLTLDQVGGSNTKIDYVDIDTADGTNVPVDTTAPTVTVVPSGTTNPGGAFVGSATVTINAVDNGSGVKNTTYSLDGGAAQAYNAPFTVSTVGSHTVTATSTDNANNTNTPPASSTFSVVAAGATALQVTSPQDFLGLGSRMVFSTVNYSTNPTQNLTLRNTSTTTPLQITNLTIGGTNPNAFKFNTGQATSFTIAPNSTATLPIRFTPTVVESNQSLLTITTGEAGVAPKTVTLGGMNARNFEGDTEPSLQAIFDALGYKDNAGVTNEGNNFISRSNGPLGDEITSPYFTRVDATRPVQFYPLANYSGRSEFAKGPFGFNNKGQANQANGGYYIPGGPATDPFGGQNQRLLPTIANGGSTAWNTPSAVFGVRNTNTGADAGYSDDTLNGAPQTHNFRVYPAKDLSGAVIPNTYLVGEDLSTNDVSPKNWDYQDHVFLLTNVAPENTPPTAAPSPGAASLNLGFGAAVAGTVVDANGNGTGFTSVQPNTAGNQLVASDINLNTTTGRLGITSAAGTSSGATNNQRNALQSRFNAAFGNWRIQSRLVGPFTALNVDNEQQAVFFGPDQNNYLKAEVEYAGGQNVLTVWLERNGSGVIVKRIPLPNVNATTLDLVIDGNSNAKTANVLYSINGGALTQLSDAAFALPGSWFSTTTPAGVLVSHANGQAFTGLYDSFAITTRP